MAEHQVIFSVLAAVFLFIGGLILTVPFAIAPGSPTTYQGHVYKNGVGVENATVQLSGTCSGTTITDATGYYNLTKQPGEGCDGNPQTIDLNATHDADFVQIYNVSASHWTTNTMPDLNFTTLVPPCTPSWSCSAYSDTCSVYESVCVNATDSNVCGVPYAGNFSEFSFQNCSSLFSTGFEWDNGTFVSNAPTCSDIGIQTGSPITGLRSYGFGMSGNPLCNVGSPTAYKSIDMNASGEYNFTAKFWKASGWNYGSAGGPNFGLEGADVECALDAVGNYSMPCSLCVGGVCGVNVTLYGSVNYTLDVHILGSAATVSIPEMAVSYSGSLAQAPTYIYGFLSYTGDAKGEFLVDDMNLTYGNVTVYNGFYCYQEFANASAACGNPKLGNYEWPGADIVYMNYSKPHNATGALWQVKFNNGTGGSADYTINITIPVDCWNVHNETVAVALQSRATISGPSYARALCDNSTGYQIIYEQYNNAGQPCIFSPPYNPYELIDGNWGTGRMFDSQTGLWRQPGPAYFSFSAYLYEEAMWWQAPFYNCTPNWSCSEYESCTFPLANASCKAVVDLNSCDIAYDGGYGEFPKNACVYPHPVDAECALTYPNEGDVPSVAKMGMNFSVDNGVFANGVANATIGLVSPETSACSGISVNATREFYNCTFPISISNLPGAYEVNATYGDNESVETVSFPSLCSVGGVVGYVRVGDAVAFPGAGPGLENVSGTSNIIVRNSGNLPIGLHMTSYNLIGRSRPADMLPASSFKVGAALNVSVQMAHGVQKNLSMVVPPSLNGSVGFWLSMPALQYVQDYYAATPWQVVGMG